MYYFYKLPYSQKEVHVLFSNLSLLEAPES